MDDLDGWVVGEQSGEPAPINWPRRLPAPGAFAEWLEQPPGIVVKTKYVRHSKDPIVDRSSVTPNDHTVHRAASVFAGAVASCRPG